MTIPRECAVHTHRDVTPLDTHHIWPRGEGGPDSEDNRVTVCPNGHRRIHDYIRLSLSSNGKPVWVKRRLYGRWVRFYGELGYIAIIRARASGTTKGEPE